MEDRSLVASLKAGFRSLSTMKDPAKWLIYGFGGRPSSSGMVVNADTAREVAAVYSCVKVISEDIGKLPLIMYKQDTNGNKERAVNHSLYAVLHDRPNPVQTPIEWREMMVSHMLLRGNAYSQIITDGSGQVSALWPLHPDRVTPKWIKIVNGIPVKAWDYQPMNGEKVTLMEGQVIHFRGLGDDPLKGLNPIEYHRETIGIALAAQEFGAKFFGNGMLSSGVLEHPGQLKPDAKKMLAQQWESLHHGIGNAHKTAVLEEGMKYSSLTINAKDAQYLESRKFQKVEVASIFRVPPHKIMDLDRATYSNIEQQSIEYVTDTLLPWMTRIEQRVKVDLMTEKDRKKYYAEHLADAQLRGDTTSRYNAYAVGRQWGWLSANDIRKRENMNLLPDEQGDQYLVPMNMVPADRVDDVLDKPSTDVPPAKDPAPTQDPKPRALPSDAEVRIQRSIKSRKQLRTQYERLIRQAYSRMTTREINAIRQAVKKYLRDGDVQGMVGYMEQFYSDHVDIVAREMRPVMTSYSDAIRGAVADEIGEDPDKIAFDPEAFAGAYAEAMGIRQVNVSQKRLRDILTSAGDANDASRAADDIDEELSTWDDTKAQQVSKWESVRALGAVSATIFAAVGMAMAWRTTGDNCPLCDQLEGKIVSGGGTFVRKGDTVTPSDSGTAPLQVEGDIGHPPLHAGCDCVVVGVRR